MTFILRSFALLLSAALIVVLLRPVVSGYYAARPLETDESSAITASNITSEDAPYHYLLGLYYQKRGNDYLDKAIESFRQSLERDPTRALAWVALSKTYSSYGDQKSAEHAIKRAAFVDRANPKVLWEAGMFYLTEGQLPKAAAQFRHYLLLMPSEQDDVCAMFYAAGAKPAFMLTQVLPREYQFHNHYFKFLMTYKQNAALGEAWEQRNSWNPENADYLAYCDFLIDKGLVQEAERVWTEFVQRLHPESASKDLSSLIFNGNFENRLQDGGFDWKAGKAEGVEVFIDKDMKRSGRSSLAAKFSGKTNPDVYIAQQTVAVEPKQRYRLLGQIKTDHLTTHNGVLLEVVGQGCPSLAAKSEVVTGTIDWRPLEVEFTTPPACTLVKVGIKREHSEKFDNKISGTAWLDEIKMTAVGNR